MLLMNISLKKHKNYLKTNRKDFNAMQEILYIIALSLGSIIALFILTKLMGYRQMSQLSMFDYINGITIGSIAAEMATSLEENFVQPLVAMIVYALAALFLSWVSTKSYKARGVIEGKPVLLLNKGKLYEKNFKKAKLDISEFLVQCRISGYFDLSELETAVLEGNGKISFLPKAANRPMIPNDLQLAPKQDYMVANIIIDGNVMIKNLQHTGNDMKWLNNQLKAKNVKDIKDILLATCDRENTVNIYLKNSDIEPKNLFI